LARTLGLDQGRGRVVVLVAGLAVAAIAVFAALTGGFAPGGTTPATPGTSPGTTPNASPNASPTGTLPAIPTATPSLTPSPSPVGVVAKRIRIERLGINLRIVEGDGTDAPLNKAAHYPGTSWPGGGTNIYIYAHAQKGMFLPLWDAKVGDEVLLDLADGTTARYVVTEVLPKVAWNALQYLEPTPTERLTLQTSTSYTPTAPRFVVIAEPAPVP
jgi:LPXTG-site transpeptidase (sortase) family protein